MIALKIGYKIFIKYFTITFEQYGVADWEVFRSIHSRLATFLLALNGCFGFVTIEVGGHQQSSL